MKITREQLRQIIREETSALNEQYVGEVAKELDLIDRHWKLILGELKEGDVGADEVHSIKMLMQDIANRIESLGGAEYMEIASVMEQWKTGLK